LNIIVFPKADRTNLKGSRRFLGKALNTHNKDKDTYGSMLSIKVLKKSSPVSPSRSLPVKAFLFLSQQREFTTL